MNPTERRTLYRLKRVLSDIPLPKEGKAGYANYARDMAYAVPEVGDAINEIIYGDVPAAVAKAAELEAWLDQRKAANWDDGKRNATEEET